MPCTYCGNPKHTRKQCEEMSNDFQTYEKVSTLVRQDYVESLTEKGIVPGAVVRTYNRTKNFMNKSSEVPVRGIGNLDMFSCYSGPGKRAFANASPTREHIILDDDDDRLVTPNHCYEIVEASDQAWATSFVTTQLLTEDEFKAMFKGKKRHIGFEASLFGCVVKKYTTYQESMEEIVARYQQEAEDDEAKNASDEEQSGAPIYVITFTSTSDCYKRPHTDTWAKTAISYEDAQAICLQGYLEQVSDWDTFEFNEGHFAEGFLSAAKDTDNLIESVYDFFMINGDDLFKGEFVPVTFSIDISEETTSTCSTQKITELVEELVETLEEN